MNLDENSKLHSIFRYCWKFKRYINGYDQGIIYKYRQIGLKTLL